MAYSKNIVNLVGNLGKDPEVRTFQNGNKVANFSLATSETYKDKDGNYKTITTWHQISVFGDALIGFIERNLKKGDRAEITGSLKYSEADENGVKRTFAKVEVRGRGVQKIDFAKKEDEEAATKVAAVDDEIPF